MKAANAAKMKRMISKKSHSWWWDSHISPKNSKWLAENLEEMDRSVKEMLKLIEADGDSFAKKAEMYYQKRPELVSHVEDFYRMYRALAERYDNVTGELRKNLQPDLNSQGSGSGSDYGSEPLSPLLPSFDCTPEFKPAVAKPGHRATGFKFVLDSGGSSDKSKKGSDDSSSSSSESDSDDSKDLNGDGDGISSGLHQRILELENELCIVKEKLSEHEKCGELVNGHADLSSKISVLENELIIANGKIRFSEEEIFSLQQQLKEKNLSSEAMSAELGYENMVISKLETRVLDLESEVRDSKHETEDLKGVISASNLTIEQYKTLLADASEKFLQEKSHLDADILNLEGVIKELKEEIERISQEKLQLVTSTLEQQHLIEELKSAAALSKNFLQEKSHFEADTLKLEVVIKDLKEDIKRISKEKSQLEACILEQQHLIEELKATAEVSADKFSREKSSLKAEIFALSQSNAFLEAKLIQVETEKVEACTERDGQIAELNVSVEALKQKVANMLLEKDELGVRIISLNDDIRCRDDRVRQMDEHLHQLHLEHVKLLKEIEEARKAGTQLKERVRELEEEVEKQRVALSDGAEGKREAIRQLCFSLEHYRDGYHHLRQVLQGHGKRPPTVMAI